MFPEVPTRDQVLTQVSLDYRNADYISEQIMPVINVEDYSGDFYEFDKQHLSDTDSVRAPGDEAKQVGFGLKSNKYGPLIDHALKTKVTKRALKLFPKEFDAMAAATNRVKSRLMLSREISLATYMKTDGNFSGRMVTLSGNDQWSAYAQTASDPIADVEAAKEAVRQKIFVVPNALILSYSVFMALIHHPVLLERFKYSERAALSIEHLKVIFGVEKIIIGAARYVTSNEGQSTVTTSDIWGKDAWVAHILDPIVPEEVTFGATLMMPSEAYADKWYEQKVRSYWVEVGETYEQKVIAADAIYRIKNAIA